MEAWWGVARRALSMACALAAVLPFGAHAQLQSVGSRFSAGISSFPPAPDIAGMGSASSAVPYSSGANSAALVYFDQYGEYRPRLGLSYNYVLLGHEKGPDAEVRVHEMSGKLGSGYFRLAYARYDSDREKILGQPFALRFSGDTLQLAYAHRVFEGDQHKLALGANFIVNEGSDSKVYLGPLGVGSVKATGARIPSLQVGLLYEWNNKIFLGVTYDHFRSVSTTSILGFGLGEDKETVEVLRPGIALRPWKGATLGIDWQVGKVRSDSFDVPIDAFFFGIEQFVHKNLAFYLGSADGGFTTGVWMSIKDRVAISYGYQDKGLRALEPVFGRSSIHTLSVGVSF